MCAHVTKANIIPLKFVTFKFHLNICEHNVSHLNSFHLQMFANHIITVNLKNTIFLYLCVKAEDKTGSTNHRSRVMSR